MEQLLSPLDIGVQLDIWPGRSAGFGILPLHLYPLNVCFHICGI